MQKITANLDDGYDEIIQSIDEYERRLTEKTKLLVNELAKIGAQSAQEGFGGASYTTGDATVTVRPESRGETSAAVVAEGEAVLFIEFGAGYLMGTGHPEPMGFGAGTYPTKRHDNPPNWKNPNGWVYGGVGRGKYRYPLRTYGNAPSAAMYNARKELEQNLKDLAKGILQS